MTTVKDVIDAMDEIAPPALALEGDPIGLHAGSRRQPVSRILVALDASLAAVAEAKTKKADMLVVHHPRFYKGLETVSCDDPSGNRAATIARQGLAVFSAHTNFDVAPGGTNDSLAEAAGLKETRALVKTATEKLVKIAVFVPASHVEQVLKAMAGAGAGAIGNYSECTFRTRGTGTFRCGENTSPFQGKPGSREEADEYRLETIAGEGIVDRVVQAMLAAHPYEETAYDLYPLLNGGREFGLGRVGDLERPTRVDELAARLARASGSGMTQHSGRAAARVRKIAVWAGASVDVTATLRSGVDCLVTGEAGYHEIETLSDAGVATITLGHGFSEELALPYLVRELRRRLDGPAVALCRRGNIAMRNLKKGAGATAGKKTGV